MKDILIEGQRILTTSDIADAVLDYARVLFDSHRTDIVTFPSMLDGVSSQCSLLLGGSAPLASVEVTIDLPVVVPGADDACAEIVRRTDALR